MTRKHEILNKAYEVFNQKGYHKTTMKEIVDSLTIKRTTLYDYFSSKEAIVFDLIENMFLQSPLKESEGTFLDRLDDLSRQMLTRVKENIGVYRLLFTALPALDETMNQKISTWQVPFYTYLNDIVDSSNLTASEKNLFIFLYRSLIATCLSDYITKELAINIDKDLIQINNIVLRWLANGKT